ncbi:MAG: hypothetical protein ACREIB_11810, partial [Pseudomonadota bacterium]
RGQPLQRKDEEDRRDEVRQRYLVCAHRRSFGAFIESRPRTMDNARPIMKTVFPATKFILSRLSISS